MYLPPNTSDTLLPSLTLAERTINYTQQGPLEYSFYREIIDRHSDIELWGFGMEFSLPPTLQAQPVSPPTGHCLDLFSKVPVALPWLIYSCRGVSWLHPTWTSGEFLFGELELETSRDWVVWFWSRGHISPMEYLTTLPPSRRPTIFFLSTQSPHLTIRRGSEMCRAWA